MKAYKFRGADQIPFALDILLKRRLYCADWRMLNDPLEGSFSYRYSTLSQHGVSLNTDYFDEQAELVVDEKKKKKVCSLSLTLKSPLLWAHYASGFTGLALEIDLPDVDDRIHGVTYCDNPSLDVASGNQPSFMANQVLSKKFSAWRYEEEVRIIQDEVWFDLGKVVTKVFCGSKMSAAMFEALSIVCASKGVDIAMIHIDHDGIDPSGNRSPAALLARAQNEIRQRTGDGA